MWIPGDPAGKRRGRSTALSTSGILKTYPAMCGQCWTTNGTAGATSPALRCTATARTPRRPQSAGYRPARSGGGAAYLCPACGKLRRGKDRANIERRSHPRRPFTAQRKAASPPQSQHCGTRATVRRIPVQQHLCRRHGARRVRKLNYKSKRPSGCPATSGSSYRAPTRASSADGALRPMQSSWQPAAVPHTEKTTPTGGACPVRYVRRKDGTDRQRPAPLLPLLHSGKAARSVGAAISAHARLRKLGAVKLQTYTPQPLTYALVHALVQTIIVSPPENDQRTIK